MKTLRQQLDDLESAAANRFSELLKNQREDLNFLENEEDELMDCEIVELYDEVNGGTFSAYVTEIQKEGMIAVIFLDEGYRTEIRFCDLANVLDRITVIELLETL